MGSAERLYNPYEGISSAVDGRGLPRSAYRLPKQPEFLFSEEAAVHKRSWSENMTYYTGLGYLSGAQAPFSHHLCQSTQPPIASAYCRPGHCIPPPLQLPTSMPDRNVRRRMSHLFGRVRRLLQHMYPSPTRLKCHGNCPVRAWLQGPRWAAARALWRRCARAPRSAPTARACA